MKNWLQNSMILLGMAILMIGLFFVLIHARKVSPVPEDSIGNTGGNLYNGGMFCEHEGTVYFSNAYDSNTLYSMTADEQSIRKLSDSVVSSINAAGDYLFYYQSSSAASSTFGSMFRINGLYRSDQKGARTVCLAKCFVPAFVLSGNTLFYQMYDTNLGTSLCRVNIDKKNQIELIPRSNINPMSVQDGKLYYAGTGGDHNLYALDEATNAISTVTDQIKVYNPVIQGDYIYYMDVANNYCLNRYHRYNETTEQLTGDRVDCFNLNDRVIYYQKNDETDPCMMRMNLDGSNPERIADGIYTNINFTSQYAYFNKYGADTPIYRSSLTGMANADEFTAAAQAAMQNEK